MRKFLITILTGLTILSVFAQEQLIKTEFNLFTEHDGDILINVIIDGNSAIFILDLAGANKILPEFADKAGVTHDAVKGACSISNLSIGNNVYANELEFTILDGEEADYLRKAGITGTINGTLFKNVILTIDKRGNRIITSIPHKPKFINVSERIDCNIKREHNVEFEILLNGQPQLVLFDTREKAIMRIPANKPFSNSDLSLVNVRIKRAHIEHNTYGQQKDVTRTGRAVAGLGLLDYGIISIDYLRSKIYFQSYENTPDIEESGVMLKEILPGKLNEITKDEFIEYIYDYKNHKDFLFKGDKPAVIDFWATWCGPCMKLLPIMEQIAEKYKNRVVFYKVNSDVEKELCAIFGIKVLPTLFFIPVGGRPIIDVGAQPEKYINIIEEILQN